MAALSSLVISLCPAFAWAQPAPEELNPAPAGPFAAGRVRLSILLGSSISSSGDTYLVLGASGGYFVLDGLELGLDYEAWLLAHPALQRLSPEARYVFYFVPAVQPYLGAFYRHTFVSDYTDWDSVGGRGGIFFLPQGNVFLGAGVAYERVLACQKTELVDCDAVYPEFSIAIGF